MPPSVRRAQRARRDVRKDATTSSDPVADSSPTRPAKRRKKTQEEESAPLPDDDQLVTQITQQLKSQAVQASKDHANAIHEANGDGVKAYAKVAAHDWTYYITRLLVNIGRAQDQGQADEDDEDQVHIDLGPGKMVSREHAAISFDSKHEQWILNIKGRNGAKVDGQPLKASNPHMLSSGEVIEIGGVEMMFVLPSEISPLHVDPAFLQRCGLSADTPQARKVRRQPPIAPTPTQLERPGTPPSTQDQSLSRLGKSPGIPSTPAVMMGANGIDLSMDENQHIKPQYSYAQMITQAILSEDDGKLNLNGIYQFIMNSYAYYRHQQTAGWQNSIRHNLSLNKAFEKVPRLTDEAGKGLKWQIVPEAKDDMVRNAYRVGRGGHRGSSAPSSPNQLNYITHGPRDMAARGPGSARKRLASPLASPSPRPPFNPGQSTPERPAARALGRGAGLGIDGSPLPRAQKNTPATSSYSSFNPQSPTLTSSYLQDDNASFVTPAPPRVHPKLAPPSTAQRPSQHMPTSSPAPFWKYADIGSTPLKPIASYELSPSKTAGPAPPPSSSPPPPAHKSLPSSPSKPQTDAPEAEPEADDEQGFDLTKGFQSIGAYHAPVGRGVPVPNALQGRT